MNRSTEIRPGFVPCEDTFAPGRRSPERGAKTRPGFQTPQGAHALSRRQLSRRQKSAGGPGGGPPARVPVGGRGGWGRDRPRGSETRVLAALAGDGGRRRPGIAERDPDVGVLLRLALDEAV